MADYNRRTFLRTAGAGVALGVATPGSVLTASPKNALQNKSKYPALKFDVAVVGAGASGIPAAIAAAREGAKVILLEEDMQPGGAPVDMFVTYLIGDPRVGIFNQLIRELNAKHSLTGSPTPDFGHDGNNGRFHWWLPSSFSIVLNQMISQERNLTLMCGASVVDIIVEAKANRNLVKGVRIMRNGMLQDVLAKVTIDATGTGLVASQAGCEYMYGTEAKSDFNESIGLEVGNKKPQSCTWMYITQRLRKDAVIPFDNLDESMHFLENNFGEWLSRSHNREDTAKRDAGIYLRWGATTECSDTLDTVAIAQSQRELLGELSDQIKILREAGFATHLAPKIGVRECRRIMGEYVITYDDIAQGKMPDDKIADARYSIDVWGMKDLPVHLKQVPPYGIPYRSLIPLNTEGLLTAGRIISGTKIAASSYRVQPIAAAIGEAAGVAAAMTALNNTNLRDIEIKKLIARLDAKGMFEAYKNFTK